jgi:hypothetical protein
LPDAGVTLFSDDFESGALDAWTVSVGLRASTADRHGGQFGARATAAESEAFAYRDLAGQAELTVSVWFRFLTEPEGAVYLMRTATTGGKYGGGVYRAGSGSLAFRSPISDLTLTSTVAVETGTWYEVRLHQVISGPGGRLDLWLDGVPVEAISGSQDLGVDPIGRIQIGDDNAGRTFDVVFDDVEAAAPASAQPSPSPTVIASPSAVQPSPAASLHPAAISDLRAALVTSSRLADLGAEVDAAVQDPTPETADIAASLRAISAVLTTAVVIADRLADDQPTQSIGTDLAAGYAAIREDVRAGLALGLANVSGYLAAGRATVESIADLRPIDGRVRDALGAVGA